MGCVCVCVCVSVCVCVCLCVCSPLIIVLLLPAPDLLLPSSLTGRLRVIVSSSQILTPAPPPILYEEIEEGLEVPLMSAFLQ